ncbi:MAG: radical SAM protein [Nanobdellota archaeon]
MKDCKDAEPIIINHYNPKVLPSLKNEIKKLKKLRDNNEKILIKTVISKHNYHYLQKISNLIGRINPKQVVFEILEPEGLSNEKIKRDVPFKTILVSYLESGIQFLSDRNIEVIVKNMPYCILYSKAGYIEEKNKSWHNLTECNGCLYEKICPKISKMYSKYISKTEIKRIVRPAPEPEVVANLRLGLQCNADCLYCTITDDHDENMNTQQAKNMLFDFAMNGFNRVTITGGEPTLRNDLIELLRCAKINNLKSDLQTNAILLSDEEYVKKIKEQDIYQVTVGIPSHIKSKYNYLTHTKSYEKAIKGIMNCVKLNSGIVSLYYVINKENYMDMLDFIDFAHNISEDITFAFAFLRPNGSTQNNKQIVPTLVEIEEQIYNMLEKTKSLNSPPPLEGVPLCFMKGYENRSAETFRIFQMAPVNYGSGGKSQHDDLHWDIFSRLKSKSEKCKKCNLNSICAGVWTEYAQIHGTNELRPVLDRTKEDVLN